MLNKRIILEDIVTILVGTLALLFQGVFLFAITVIIFVRLWHFVGDYDETCAKIKELPYD